MTSVARTSYFQVSDIKSQMFDFTFFDGDASIVANDEAKKPDEANEVNISMLGTSSMAASPRPD